MSYWNYLPDNKDRQNVTEGHTVIRFRMRKPNLHLGKLNLHLSKLNLHLREPNLHLSKLNLHLRKPDAP